MLMVFDTETDGLVQKNFPASHPSQPHLVQLACLLIDGSGREYASVSLIVKPEGYLIHEQASKIHGITTELAHDIGVPLRVAVACFTNLRALADDGIAAHNMDFDQMVMDAAIHRIGAKPSNLGPARRICTMRESSELVGLPPTDRMRAAGFDKNKPPNLNELHKFLFGEGFAGAHDAMTDARACARCLLELRKRGLCL